MAHKRGCLGALLVAPAWRERGGCLISYTEYTPPLNTARCRRASHQRGPGWGGGAALSCWGMRALADATIAAIVAWFGAPAWKCGGGAKGRDGS